MPGEEDIAVRCPLPGSEGIRMLMSSRLVGVRARSRGATGQMASELAEALKFVPDRLAVPQRWSTSRLNMSPTN